MRFDIFMLRGTEWVCYVQAVTKANAIRILAALERDNEHVAAFYHARTMGRMVYRTGEGWNFRKAA